MKILITGSNGIIGRQVLSQLLDSYPSAYITVVNRHTDDQMLKDRVKSIEMDLLTISDKNAYNLFNSLKPDLFFHLAWDTGHKDYLTTSDNLKWEKISLNLIDNFYKAGGKRFIGIGSSIEYNWKSGSCFDEIKSDLNGNGWLYGQSKLAVFRYLNSIPGISYVWCRVFFVFGPGQSPTRLIPVLINNALFGDCELRVNVKMKRDYISTFEIARQIIMMVKTDYSGPVNICSGRAIKLGEFVEGIQEYSGRKILLSPLAYQDNFENEEIKGNTALFHSYYPGYSYSHKDFISDLNKTIDSFNIPN